MSNVIPLDKTPPPFKSNIFDMLRLLERAARNTLESPEDLVGNLKFVDEAREYAQATEYPFLFWTVTEQLMRYHKATTEEGYYDK